MTTSVLDDTQGVITVVEAYRLDRYDNDCCVQSVIATRVVEAYRLDRYDNFNLERLQYRWSCCRSLSFG